MKRRPLTILIAVAMALGVVASPVAAHSPKFPSSRSICQTGWMPEGITAGRGNTIYVGSLAGGGVWKGERPHGPGSSVHSPLGRGSRRRRVRGPRNDRLWVAGGPTGTVRVYNASTGALLRQYTFDPAGFLNDLVVTRNAVYVTNSNNAWLDVIPFGRHGRLPAVDATTTLPLTGIVFEEGRIQP